MPLSKFEFQEESYLISYNDLAEGHHSYNVHVYRQIGRVVLLEKGDPPTLRIVPPMTEITDQDLIDEIVNKIKQARGLHN